MKRLWIGFAAALMGITGAGAQSMDDLNIQIHGYATQGFLYTTNNNILTTTSSDGSPSWTDAVVNVTAQPDPKLRIGMQARYSMLGTLGNQFTLDWASADYKVNDKIGVQFGKIKVPSNLFNQIQDIDPAYMWSLLPQGIYDVLSRNGTLSVYGGMVHGTVPVGERLGKIEYGLFEGENIIPSTDGYFIYTKNNGTVLPNGTTHVQLGGSLAWKTPLRGLTFGTAVRRFGPGSYPVTAGTHPGSQVMSAFYSTDFYGKYEHQRWMLAGEYYRVAPIGFIELTGLPIIVRLPLDNRSWYAMATYKVSQKLMAGVYQSQFFNRKAPLIAGRYSKDWTLSARYDFNEYLYAKAEQHFIDGTAISYDYSTNPGGLNPKTKMTILKIGVSF